MREAQNLAQEGRNIHYFLLAFFMFVSSLSGIILNQQQFKYKNVLLCTVFRGEEWVKTPIININLFYLVFTVLKQKTYEFI